MSARARMAKWSELITIRPRFQRSVHLERDALHGSALDGYLVTPLVRSLVGRVVEGLQSQSGTRAWSVTGPYGTGKSAFALFLAQMLRATDSDLAGAARELLRKHDATLHARLCEPASSFDPSRGLVPVLATGERASLEAVLLRSLHGALERYWGGPGKKPAVLHEVAKAAQKALDGHAIGTRHVVALFEEAATRVQQSSLPGRGLLVILDEAGKVLEHATHHPSAGDVILLQELAERANRSGDTPIVLVVFLHQGFEQYAGRLSATERSEWVKIQGRFEDLAFQESSHEVLRLVGRAFERARLPKEAQSRIGDLSAQVARDVARPSADIVALLAQAAPLHPVTALLVGPIFRSGIAQNERSLFAFLASSEPHGFREFLDSPCDRLLTPDRLYDYIASSLGGRLHGHIGRAWAQVETALRRLPEGAGETEAALLKTIGLLGIFGDGAGVVASPEVLRLVYGEPADRRALDGALERLKRASLIVFRKYRGGYQLWEGSDLDIDDLTRSAFSQLDVQSSLVARLARIAAPRPLVARRHLFETGTFRYFDLKYVDGSVFAQEIPDASDEADGTVLLVVEPNAAERARVTKFLAQPMAWLRGTGGKPVLVGVPTEVGRLLEIGSEIAALEWVQSHTPELSQDPVAQREVSSRLVEAERQLRDVLTTMLSGGLDCQWFAAGPGRRLVSTARDLTRIVSDLCDASYEQAPHIHNELLNRRQLSSAAAAARRTLMDAMVEKAGVANLGIEGAPPELSMYRSLLEAHGLHGSMGTGFGFGAPMDKERGALGPVWRCIVDTLKGAQEQRVKLSALYDHLRRPPFGLKDGVLPVVIIAALLAMGDDVALYEDGVFVPQLTGPTIERLPRQPDRFELQHLSIAGPRAAVYSRLTDTLVSAPRGQAAGVIPLVRALVRVARQLNDFARNTRSVSPEAQAVREILLRAREPAPLLFRDLPRAVGFEPFGPRGARTPKEAADFVAKLRAALGELRLAYPKLLDEVERSLQSALNLQLESSQLREELAARCTPLIPFAIEAPLKAFLIRIADDALPRDEWLVSVATLLGGKPPDSWLDRDFDHMQLQMSLLARRFASLEAMVSATGIAKESTTPMLRLAVAQVGKVEEERVIPLRPSENQLLQAAYRNIQEVAAAAASTVPREVVLAALGMVARDLMEGLNAGRSTKEAGADA